MVEELQKTPGIKVFGQVEQQGVASMKFFVTSGQAPAIDVIAKGTAVADHLY